MRHVMVIRVTLATLKPRACNAHILTELRRLHSPPQTYEHARTLWGCTYRRVCGQTFLIAIFLDATYKKKALCLQRSRAKNRGRGYLTMPLKRPWAAYPPPRHRHNP